MRTWRTGRTLKSPEKVGVGTEVRRLLERSSSTRFVRPRKAVGSIWPILQCESLSFWRFRSPCRLKTSRGKICRLLPPRSRTWNKYKNKFYLINLNIFQPRLTQYNLIDLSLKIVSKIIILKELLHKTTILTLKLENNNYNCWQVSTDLIFCST